MYNTIMNQVTIDREFIPHIAIWAEKRADGAERKAHVPFVVGDFVVAKSFGLHFVPDKHFALKHDGLTITGIAAELDEIDIHRDMLKFHIAIVVQNEDDKLLIEGSYKIVGWTTRRELKMNALPSKEYGMNGTRMTFDMLRDMGELESAMDAGEILIDVEEEEEWWQKI